MWKSGEIYYQFYINLNSEVIKKVGKGFIIIFLDQCGFEIHSYKNCLYKMSKGIDESNQYISLSYQNHEHISAKKYREITTAIWSIKWGLRECYSSKLKFL